ncbi:hypothetical protein [Pacificibacter marinus]|nr:hypothetical protein [Pacificibacter marinus]
MHRHLSRIFLALVFGLMAADPSLAAGGYWEFGAWRVIVEEIDTGEDLRRTCTAMTGGDGDMSAVLTVSNGDAGPPDYYPELLINEHAIRGYDTRMQASDEVYLWFDDEDVIDGTIEHFFDDDGFAHAQVFLAQSTSQAGLRAMKRNGQMDVTVNGRAMHTFWLNGFSASYLKMMDECGFDGSGVLDLP